MTRLLEYVIGNSKVYGNLRYIMVNDASSSWLTEKCSNWWLENS